MQSSICVRNVQNLPKVSKFSSMGCKEFMALDTHSGSLLKSQNCPHTHTHMHTHSMCVGMHPPTADTHPVSCVGEDNQSKLVLAVQHGLVPHKQLQGTLPQQQNGNITACG